MAANRLFILCLPLQTGRCPPTLSLENAGGGKEWGKVPPESKAAVDAARRRGKKWRFYPGAMYGLESPVLRQFLKSGGDLEIAAALR